MNKKKKAPAEPVHNESEDFVNEHALDAAIRDESKETVSDDNDIINEEDE